MYVATLVRAEGLSARSLAAASDALAQAGAEVGGLVWIEPGVAADLAFAGVAPAVVRAALEAALPDTDVIAQIAAGRRRMLLVADMDSTMITVECIDELADYAGIKAEVAAVTEAAMRGELDFADALHARVALLAGLPARTIERCRAERVRLMPGARALVRTMRARGARTVLVSGGFTAFADPVGAEIGFERVVANELLISGGALTGKVATPIVDSATKLDVLRAEAGGGGLLASLAVGDGANDIPMIEAAGLGVAYHAKPKTAVAAGAAVRFGDLTVLLYAQGYPRRDWVS